MDDKNNKPLKPIEKIEKGKQGEKESLRDIPESKEEMAAREKTIKLDLMNEHIQEIKSIREERKKYANKTFWFLSIYIITVIVIVVAYDLATVLQVILIGTIPASMVLFGWVLRGLFPYR